MLGAEVDKKCDVRAELLFCSLILFNRFNEKNNNSARASRFLAILLGSCRDRQKSGLINVVLVVS